MKSKIIEVLIGFTTVIVLGLCVGCGSDYAREYKPCTDAQKKASWGPHEGKCMCKEVTHNDEPWIEMICTKEDAK